MRKRHLKGISFIQALIMIVSLFALFPATVLAEDIKANNRQILNFNSDWGFYRGDLDGAEAIDYDDEAFANVTVPHTMNLEKKHCTGSNSTYKGIGWYRRYFTVDPKNEGQNINIDFEGVMIDSDVYLNGEKVYTRNGGYVGFSVDISDKVKFGETNVLAVRVSNLDNPDTPPGKPENSMDFHYYGGIYRDVTMRITDNLYISDSLQADKTASGGVFVTYPEVSKEEASVNVKTHVQNDGAAAANTTVLSKLLDADGNVVAQAETAAKNIAAGGDFQFDQTFTVTNPNLWHPDHPYLYTIVSEVHNNGTLVDSTSTKAGIRTIKYDAQGFYINGEKLYLRGANRHQCYQTVGDAASNSMQARDAYQMKANGFNAVRAAHYPQDPAFLAACDEVGLLVIECQPGWQNFTNNQVFYDRTMRDIKEMIRRDRNHPSIVLWEASLNETHWSGARDWAKDAMKLSHEEFPGDQFYAAQDYGNNGDLYDVAYKVQDTQWSNNPNEWIDYDPTKPFFTREWGDYEGSSKALRRQGEKTANTQIITRQKYLNGNGYSDWGGLDASDRIGGHFLWSWNDYPRGSNSTTLGSGTVDLDRYEKYCYYWLQSMQPARHPSYGPVLFIASTYSETSDLNVNVFSNCDSVKLYQNNTLVQEITREDALKSVPNIAKKGGSPIFTFQLPEFIKGELRAEAILDGTVIRTHTVKTPEQATRFEVEIRDRGITPIADGSDLIPVYIKAVDDNGTIVPDYKGVVTVSVTGEGELVGKDIPRIKLEHQTLEAGIGFAFVRTSHTAGTIEVTATADDMTTSSSSTTTAPFTGTFVADGEHTPWVGGVEKLEGEILKNIAIGKPVTASSEQSGNIPSNITDDDEGTRWCASGGGLPQWVQIDLGKREGISGFQILWENSSSVYKYDIEVSDDGTTWTKAVDKSANESVNGTVDTQLIETVGRFIRLNITGISDGWASLYELRVIPKETTEDIEPGDIITDNAIKSITASTDSVAGRGTDKLRDGITEIGSGWLSSSKEFPQNVTVEFDKPQNLVGSRIYWEKDSSWYTYNLEVSTDGKSWTKAIEDQTIGGQHYKPETFTKVQENIKFARVNITNITAGGEVQIGMAELILYGSEYKEPEPEPIKEFEYASDLTWEAAHSDYASVTKDAAAYGGSLVLNTPEGPVTHRKGLSADTDSYIIYDITGKNYTRFEAYIGINANASKQGGEAIFKVYKNDVLSYTSPMKMRNDNCEFISIDLTGVTKLKLEAVWSRNQDNPEARYNTHVNWSDAKFYNPHPERILLQQAYDAEIALDRQENDFTVNSWNRYAAALNAAKDALASADDTQDFVTIRTELTAAAEALEEIQHNLRTETLAYVVEIAEQLKRDDALKNVVETVVNRFNAALEAGTTILADATSDRPSVTQEEIDNATAELLNVFTYLEFKGDKTDLNKVILLADGINQNLDRYLTAGKAEFIAAYNEAKELQSDGDALNEEITTVWKKLLTAMSNLRLKPSKDALKDLYAKAQSYDLNLLTDQSASQLRAALTKASAVIDNPEADAQQVREAQDALSDALSNIQLKTVAGTGSTATTLPTGTQTGSVKTSDHSTVGMALSVVIFSGLAVFAIKRRKKGNF